MSSPLLELVYERGCLRIDLQVGQHKMAFDSNHSMRMYAGQQYEPFETMVMSRLIKQGDIVLDLGAHIGYFTLIFAKLVGPTGLVFAFELTPTSFSVLEHNIAINGYTNVILEQAAVSDKTQRLKLYTGREITADNRIYDSHDGKPFIEVQAVSLDDYFSVYTGEINFIKMDIQGAEKAAIQGMPSLLRRSPGVIIFSEFWPFGLTTFGFNPVDYLTALQRYGFLLRNINDKRGKLETISDFDTFAAQYPPATETYTNILATR